MIDFRYHLVSLIAVFLAIALGLVIGATQLSGPLLDNLQGQVASLQEDKRALEDQTQGLQAQADTSNAFESAVAPALVAGTLVDRDVLLVRASEEVTTDTVEEVTALVTAAGGTVTGRVTVEPEYSDPAGEAGLQSYVTGPGRPVGVTLPETDDTGQLVGALLAQVLMVPADPAVPAPDTAAISTVFAGLTALDVLSQDSASVAPADFAVVLTAGALDGEDAADRNDTLLDLVTALDAAGSGAVVAGDAASAGENGLVGAIRADPEVSAAVSTVDNVGSPAGQISTVLALGREGEGTSGKYGSGEDTQPVPPVPAATP
ncbi:Copper transport outer membrane protein, MctB [Geodermatophilus dictyosporus]|uniref:Copper transport outer membrane protein, MctB n=1 Tax=Geodermatophilus dictyosporus TaxID=1523247 RepID=A0A1I5K393_9ACTN|nr:copper transporter [Geodermatophilus dictyosporus]SFO79469.1 Copper transport outer membrane protein, MctB [Geodermatophilus dictyosporus]